jgi:hypothetical protein
VQLTAGAVARTLKIEIPEDLLLEGLDWEFVPYPLYVEPDLLYEEESIS